MFEKSNRSKISVSPILLKNLQWAGLICLLLIVLTAMASYDVGFARMLFGGINTASLHHAATFGLAMILLAYTLTQLRNCAKMVNDSDSIYKKH